jgi:hypothetical protein
LSNANGRFPKEPPLKKLVAEVMLANEGLKEVLAKK